MEVNVYVPAEHPHRWGQGGPKTGSQGLYSTNSAALGKLLKTKVEEHPNLDGLVRSDLDVTAE